MLKLSKKVDYGLIAISHIAHREDDRNISAKQIAEQYDIPVELLAKILQRLAKGGLIMSQNGPKGGYILARDPAHITVG
jgi:Rrf2 family protein